MDTIPFWRNGGTVLAGGVGENSENHGNVFYLFPFHEKPVNNMETMATLVPEITYATNVSVQKKLMQDGTCSNLPSTPFHSGSSLQGYSSDTVFYSKTVGRVFLGITDSGPLSFNYLCVHCLMQSDIFLVGSLVATALQLKIVVMFWLQIYILL